MNRVIGVDPGSRTTGYGIVEEHQGKLTAIAFGGIRLMECSTFSGRLKKLYDELQKIIHQYKPQEAAIETVFFSKNVASALKLGQARGAAITAFANGGLRVNEYSPTQVKQAVIGYGRSDKLQLQKMISLMLGVFDFEEFDSSDALAVAICHLNSVKLQTIRDQHDRSTSR